MTLGRELTLYLQSEEDGELRLRPVARGKEAVERMMRQLKLRSLGIYSVINRRGKQVGYLVKNPTDILEIRKVHAQLREDLLRSTPREDIAPINLAEMVFLETPK